MSTVAMSDLAVVASPWTLGPLTLSNRVVMGSMHTGSRVHDDGGAGMAAFYRERAEGGRRASSHGGIAVNDEARGGPDFAVFVAGERHRFRAAVDAVHESGSVILAQLFHAGGTRWRRGWSTGTGPRNRASPPRPCRGRPPVAWCLRADGRPRSSAPSRTSPQRPGPRATSGSTASRSWRPRATSSTSSSRR